jgi:hypothetical protein
LSGIKVVCPAGIRSSRIRAIEPFQKRGRWLIVPAKGSSIPGVRQRP